MFRSRNSRRSAVVSLLASVLGILLFSWDASVVLGQNSTGSVDKTKRLLLDPHIQYSPFNTAHEDFAFRQLDWNIDISAMQGMPHEYAVASAIYLEKAIEMLRDKGKVPQRLYYRLKVNADKGRPSVIQKWTDFPYVARVIDSYFVDTTLMLVPEPEVANAIRFPHELALQVDHEISNVQDPPKYFQDYSSISTTEYFIANEENIGVSTYPSSPMGYKMIRGFHPSILEGNGKVVRTKHSLKSFIDYPHDRRLSSNRGDFTPIGLLASLPVCSNNSVLRLACFKDGNGKTKQWLAYCIVDANGAFKGTDFDDINSITCLRDLNAPFNPKVDFQKDHQLPNHSLLLLPENEHAAADIFTERWTITDKYYSEHDEPIWILWIVEGSDPWRERFKIKHWKDSPEKEPWKVIVFPDNKPAALINAIAKLKKVQPNELPTKQQIEEKLEPYYNAVIKSRQKYTLHAPLHK